MLISVMDKRANAIELEPTFAKNPVLWATIRYPLTAWCFSRCDRQLVTESVEHFHRLALDFPVYASHIRFVGTAVGFVTSEGSSVRLFENPEFTAIAGNSTMC